MGMGLRFEQRDLCSGTMGFSQNLGWEMGIGSPLQGPHTYMYKNNTTKNERRFVLMSALCLNNFIYFKFDLQLMPCNSH